MTRFTSLFTTFIFVAGCGGDEISISGGETGGEEIPVSEVLCSTTNCWLDFGGGIQTPVIPDCVFDADGLVEGETLSGGCAPPLEDSLCLSIGSQTFCWKSKTLADGTTFWIRYEPECSFPTVERTSLEERFGSTCPDLDYTIPALFEDSFCVGDSSHCLGVVDGWAIGLLPSCSLDQKMTVNEFCDLNG